MKKAERNPEKFGVFDLFDSIGQRRGLTLQDETSIQAFLESISLSLKDNSTPTMLYGRHVEAMFGYIAASLGKCSIVKKEDSGDMFLDIGAAKAPDYRIITKDGMQYLVEVKNFRTDDFNANFRVTKTYLNELLQYSKANNALLKIAVYWSRMNLWTLLSSDALQLNDDKYEINLSEAMKYNEMSVLGDVMIATTPDLSIRIYTDKKAPHRIDDNGLADFTIGAVKVFCNGVQVTDKLEQNMAVSLMMYGTWNELPPTAKITENELDYIEFIYKPIEYVEDDGFSSIGIMSSIISNQYKSITAPDGKIEKITPNIDTGMLGFTIPADYKGKNLPLWRFHIQAQENPAD